METSTEQRTLRGRRAWVWLLGGLLASCAANSRAEIEAMLRDPERIGAATVDLRVDSERQGSELRDVRGRVELIVDGWIAVVPDSADDWIEGASGFDFAVHDQQVYKGEALVVGTKHGRYLCRLTVRNEHRVVVGDCAWVHVE